MTHFNIELKKFHPLSKKVHFKICILIFPQSFNNFKCKINDITLIPPSNKKLQQDFQEISPILQDQLLIELRKNTCKFEALFC